MPSPRKLLVVEVAGLGWDLVSRLSQHSKGPVFHKLETVFPALTCTAQASFRTASLPREHGMISNGLFFRNLRKPMFWEQSASLVAGERIWEKFRERGKRVGMMFWQQSLGEDVDLILSPAPIHKHGGGMIQDCYSRPGDLYARLTQTVGRPFNLMHYWGPMASRKSSDWIVAATRAVMAMTDVAPDLLLSYLPHLDYDFQRFGSGSRQADEALRVMANHLNQLQVHAKATGYDFLFFGDYAMAPVTKGPVFPNRALREAGLFFVRPVKWRAYADFHSSAAFAMVDHEIAHVFASDENATRHAKDALLNLPGVGEILDRPAQQKMGVDHPHSGDLVLIAEEGFWFAYPWWSDRKEAPDYATHVDIHNKPGYDPCELFFGWPPLSVSLDATRIRGSHGRNGAGREVAWASSCRFDDEPTTLIDLSRDTKKWIESRA